MSDTENIDTANPASASGEQGGPGTGMLGGRGAGVPTLEQAQAELANSSPEERQEMLEIARRLLSAQSLMESAAATADILAGGRGPHNNENDEDGDGSGGNLSPPPPPPANPMEAMFSRETDAPDLDITAANIIVSKADRGEKGSKRESSVREAAIAPLAKQFDLFSHQHTYSTGGEATGRSVDQSMKTQLTTFLALVKIGKERAKGYDMLDISDVYELAVAPTPTVSCTRWWDPSSQPRNVWDSWDVMKKDQVS